MKFKKYIKGLFITVFAVIPLVAIADDDDDHEEHHDKYKEKKSIVAPENSQYKAECASCHMAYPPSLLPIASWEKMMSDLKNHFGENASLDKKVSDEILSFLKANAADSGGSKRGQKIASSINSKNAPLRFSDTTYFKRQHHELNAKIFQRKSIGSAANCLACHKNAENGNFDEDEVVIPK